MLSNKDPSRGKQRAWKPKNCPAKSLRGYPELLLFNRLITTYDLKVVFVSKESFMLIGMFNIDFSVKNCKMKHFFLLFTIIK